MHIDEFIEFEKENNLFELDIEGFKYWQYIRFKVYNEIFKEKYHTGQSHANISTKSYYKRVILKLKQIPNCIFMNPLWFLKQKDLLVLNHQRRVKNGDYFDCIYTDNLLKKNDYSYYVFEQPILEDHYRPTRTNNMRYFDYIYLKVAFKKEIKRKIFKFRLKEKYEEQLRNTINDFNQHFKVSLKFDNLLELLENAFLTYKLSRKYYSKILDKVKPKAILEVVSYGADRLSINELAKERGIPVIELQHGTMGKYHVAYNFSENIKIATFPDYLFVFGQFWKQTTRLPINNDRVKVVGWDYFEQKVNTYKKENNRKDESKKTILFISQGTIGKELSKIAYQISNKLDMTKYRIIYKLHPGEYDRWKKEYSYLEKADIDIIDNNKDDIHYYFAQSDIQVGVGSTALFEGLGYGLKTIVVKLPGHEYLDKLYKDSIALLVKDADELVYCINSSPKATISNISYFWEPNCFENFKNEMNAVLRMRDKA